jgi:hypothetical protein
VFKADQATNPNDYYVSNTSSTQAITTISNTAPDPTNTANTLLQRTQQVLSPSGFMSTTVLGNPGDAGYRATSIQQTSETIELIQTIPTPPAAGGRKLSADEPGLKKSGFSIDAKGKFLLESPEVLQFNAPVEMMLPVAIKQELVVKRKVDVQQELVLHGGMNIPSGEHCQALLM